ncbi:hypothetical protein BDV12DRAFT_60010 [Aspergillus spectabilis]
MAKTQAVVVLQSLDLADPLPHRSLTFGSELDRVNIGRASKRENKNLAPSRKNALFDSRVMSRTHAILRVSLEEKLVYIRDPGSMHGTWVNNKKIPVNVDVGISDGDVLTFGVEVIRGSDTFPPLAVSCELQWSETPHASTSQIDGGPSNLHGSETVIQKVYQTSNTFRVPDDDDDDVECEITSHNPVTFDLTGEQGSDSDASSPGSDSEDSRSVIEVPSPMTSPLKNNGSKETRSTDSSVATTQEPPQASVESSNGVVVDSEQPLVTPRMTPPSVGYDSEDPSGENQYYDNYFAHGSDEDSSVEPEDWEEDEQEDKEEDEDEVEEEEESEEEEDEEEEEEDEAEEDAEDEEEAVKANNVPDMVHSFESSAQISRESPNRIPYPVEAANDMANIKPEQKFLGGASSETRDAPQPVRDLSGFALDPGKIQTPALSKPASDNQHSVTDSQHREVLIPRASCFTRIQPTSHPFPSLASNVQESFPQCGEMPDQYPGIEPDATYNLIPGDKLSMPTRYPLDTVPFQNSYSSRASYNDGPFTTRQPMSTAGPSSVITASNISKPDYTPFMDPLSPLMPRTSCVANVKPSSTSMPTLHEWEALSADSNATSPKKRKATEMESESPENSLFVSNLISATSPADAATSTNEDADADLPDAQPQSIAPILNTSDPQLTTVSVPQNSSEAKKDERPSKMVKTSHTGSIKSHAATAIIGAVVGAVGTIAALASLPADYFA